MKVLIVNSSGYPYRQGIIGDYVQEKFNKISNNQLSITYIAPGGVIGGQRFDLILIDLESEHRNDRLATWLAESVRCRLSVDGIYIDL